MGTPVTFNGLSVVVPENNDQGWGNDVSALLIELANFAASSTSLIQSSRVSTATPVTVVGGDFAIAVNIPSASIVNLPAGSGSTGKCYIVYDFSGAGKVNPITIVPSGLDTINGKTSYLLNNNNGSVFLQYTGTQWSIIGEYNLSLKGPQFYTQGINNSYVVSSVLPSTTQTFVADGLSSSAEFDGSFTYLFNVSANNKSFVGHTSYNSTTITAISDPDGLLSPTALGAGIYVSKGVGPVLTFKNQLGIATPIEIKSLTTNLINVTAWS